MRRLWTLRIGLLALLAAGSAWAQNQITVGGLWWAATPSLRGDGFENQGTDLIKQSSVQLLGPQLHWVVNKVVLGSTAYFGKSQWTFADYNLKMDAQRNETNVYLGFAPFPQLELLFVAQFGRSSDNDPSVYVTDPWDNDEPLVREFRYKSTLYGPAISGRFALGESGFHFSWRAGMLFGNQTWDYTSEAPTWDPGAVIDRHEKYETTMTLIQFGLGKKWESGFSIWAGYRMEFSDQEVGEESIQGFLLSTAIIVE